MAHVPPCSHIFGKQALFSHFSPKKPESQTQVCTYSPPALFFIEHLPLPEHSLELLQKGPYSQLIPKKPFKQIQYPLMLAVVSKLDGSIVQIPRFGGHVPFLVPSGPQAVSKRRFLERTLLVAVVKNSE